MKQQPESAAVTVDPKVGIAVTINGGKREVDSATLPIEWWLSDQVIAQDPKYVVIFEQNAQEISNRFGADVYGRRYFRDVKDAVKFVQIFSPGHHRVMVLVFANEKAVTRCLARKNSTEYSQSLNWEEAANNSLREDYEYSDILASTVVEIEVPTELFAQAPKTRWGKLVWRWVNLWYEDDPIDECNYGERKGLAFTIKPFLALVWWALKFLVAGTIHTLYVLFASIIIFFIGYRPRPIFKEMWEAFIWERSRGWDVKRYGRSDLYNSDFSSAYRVWHVTAKPYPKPPIIRFMPISPLLVTIIMSALYGLYSLGALLARTTSLGTLLFVIGLLLVISIVLYKFLVRRFDEAEVQLRRQLKEEAAERQQLAEQEAERQWLIHNLGLARYKTSIDLADLPTQPGVKGKVQRLYVGFWTLKAKVCKPFPK